LRLKAVQQQVRPEAEQQHAELRYIFITLMIPADGWNPQGNNSAASYEADVAPSPKAGRKPCASVTSRTKSPKMDGGLQHRHNGGLKKG
jgi:hypothetical protein